MRWRQSRRYSKVQRGTHAEDPDWRRRVVLRRTSQDFRPATSREFCLAPSRTICYAALTRFLRTTCRFVCASLLALSAARRRSSSNSRSFAEILRPMVFRWAAIFPHSILFEAPWNKGKDPYAAAVTPPGDRGAKYRSFPLLSIGFMSRSAAAPRPRWTAAYEHASQEKLVRNCFPTLSTGLTRFHRCAFK
jgi:hypothetical protein